MADPSPRERLAGALALVRNTLELPVKAGVSAKDVANAINGQPVPTIPYLRICMALRLDPAPGRHLVPVMTAPANFDFGFFSLGFCLRRRINRHNLRHAGAALNVKQSTIERIERGETMPIGVALRACEYINIHPYGYCVIGPVSRERSPASSNVSRETSPVAA